MSKPSFLAQLTLLVLACGVTGSLVACGRGNTTPSTPLDTTPSSPPDTTQEGPCSKLDAKLGTLKLHEGFFAEESSALPSGFLAVTAIQSNLFGLDGTQKTIRPLGVWPNLTVEENSLSFVVSREANSYLSQFLLNDGTSLIAGYTLSEAGAPGSIRLVDTKTLLETKLFAPGNYSAAVSNGLLLVNGKGVESHTGEPAIYAASTLSSTLKTYKVAEFDASWAAASGYTAVTSDGIAVLGYFNGTDYLNYLRAVPSAAYVQAVDTGKPLKLAEQAQVYAGADLFNVVGFGKGVALHRGKYDEKTYAPITTDVSWLPLTGGATSTSAGALRPILTVTDACTDIVFVSPMESDLLVALSDKNGTRLVRLSQKQGQ